MRWHGSSESPMRGRHFSLSCSLILLLAAVGCGLRPLDPAGDARPGPELARDADPERGKAIAERWCIACHVVAPRTPPRPEQAAAPSFTAIALDPARDSRFLVRFLDDVHPPMPTYRLFAEEKRDLLAYFAALGSGK
jgi:mono/diheme cytochrome c family protein